MSDTTTDTEGYSVPTDDDAVVCAYCGAPFAEPAFRALHWGVAHQGRLDEDERAAYKRALAEETESLRLFRLKALGVLVVLYFGFVMLYAVFT